MYIVIALLLFAAFSYYATYIDNKFNIKLIGVTFVAGAIACIAWPITISIAVISLPFYFLMKFGAKRRGEM